MSNPAESTIAAASPVTEPVEFPIAATQPATEPDEFPIRHDWSVDEVLARMSSPFHELLADAHWCHSQRFSSHEVEAARLLSIKTGGCPEDCAYCPQSARYHTGLDPAPLMATDDIVAAARDAQAQGATRFCMGTAWHSPTDAQVEGTPLHGLPEFPPLELVRMIATARLTMPASVVRLSAGRASMSDELHALSFHAGAGSIFLGDRLLTAPNHGEASDQTLLHQLNTTLLPR